MLVVEFRGSDGDYGSREEAIDAPTERQSANDIEMDASYVPAISVLPVGPLSSFSTLFTAS